MTNPAAMPHARFAFTERRRVSDVDEYPDDSDVAVQWVAADGKVLRANEAAMSLLGLSEGELVEHHLADFHVDGDLVAGLMARLRAGRPVRNLEACLRHRDGSFRYVLLSANAVRAMGNFIHARIVMRDISDRKQSEFALRQFKEMVDSAHDAIIGKTLTGIVTYWNAAAERMYGYTSTEMVGRSIAMIIPEDLPDELPELLARLARGERLEHYETQRIRRDGVRIDVSISLSPIFDANGRPAGASAIARDVTAQKQMEAQLRHSAFHDTLTGLPNRLYFNERVAQALHRTARDPAYRCAVLFLDFDGFKVVNDSLGHAAGDRLLVMIAARLQECVRPSDVVARLGGDEFTILLEDLATPGDIQLATARLRERLSVPHDVDGRQVVVTASVGVAVGDPAYERPEDLVRDADIAMYHAKSRGHARAETFDLSMRHAAHARFGLTSDLRAAIERQEFRLVYQPIVDLVTQKVHAFEALLRWDHPKRGEIHPAEFIPVAEQTGLIVPIGAWALNEACQQAAAWQVSGRAADPVRVSVNLSAKQLVREQIVEEVRDALARASLDPRSLELEITESVLLDNGDVSTRRLEALRALNVSLHVDDFGTGYSWLSYLPQFPLQAIKIERGFVHRMGSRRTDLAIVRSIVDLAASLGLSVIAEGVETVVQRTNLIRFGCRLGQGYLFAHPLSSKAARAMIQA